MRLCAHPLCPEEGSEKLGRAWWCAAHASRRKAENRAARRAQARRSAGRDTYEVRALGLVKVARALDEAIEDTTIAELHKFQCEELWRRMVRALAAAEGIV